MKLLYLIGGIALVTWVLTKKGAAAPAPASTVTPSSTPSVSTNPYVGSTGTASGSAGGTKSYPPELEMARAIVGDGSAQETSPGLLATTIMLGNVYLCVKGAFETDARCWTSRKALENDYDAALGR